jgi:hypothetical protein
MLECSRRCSQQSQPHRLASCQYANMFLIQQFGSALGTIVVSEGGVKWLLHSRYQSRTRLGLRTINHNLRAGRACRNPKRCKTSLIADWLTRTKKTPELNHLHLSDEQRTGHLPKLVDDIVKRLSIPDLPTKDSDASASPAAVQHGDLRRTQGYGCMAKRKPQRQSAKATLAEVIKEMAKPRVAMSAREHRHIVRNEVLVVQNDVEK